MQNLASDALHKFIAALGIMFFVSAVTSYYIVAKEVTQFTNQVNDRIYVIKSKENQSEVDKQFLIAYETDLGSYKKLSKSMGELLRTGIYTGILMFLVGMLLWFFYDANNDSITDLEKKKLLLEIEKLKHENHQLEIKNQLKHLGIPDA